MSRISKTFFYILLFIPQIIFGRDLVSNYFLSEEFYSEAFSLRRKQVSWILEKLNQEENAIDSSQDSVGRLFHLRIASKEKVTLKSMQVLISGKEVENSNLNASLGFKNSLHWWSFRWPVSRFDPSFLVSVKLTGEMRKTQPPFLDGHSNFSVERELVLENSDRLSGYFLALELLLVDTIQNTLELKIQQIEGPNDPPVPKN